MGWYMGCLKYPYMREGRRMIGRPSWGHPQGLLCGNRYLVATTTTTITARLSPGVYRRLKTAGWAGSSSGNWYQICEETTRRTRSTIY